MSTLDDFETDIIPTSVGDLRITFIGHGSLLMVFNGKTIHVDPFTRVADYSQLPQADILLLTHEHHDHLDSKALESVRTASTIVILTELCAQSLEGGIVMRNGDVRTVEGIQVEAVPAYNIVHTRENGQPFHPKGDGNGYILTFGDQRIYIGGDTENIPEMKKLQNIACAFLPMNLPYTMTPEMVADAACAFHPRILYPYHFGSTNPRKLVKLLGDEQGIDVRLRRMS